MFAALQETQDALGNLRQFDAALSSQQAAVLNQNKAYELSLRRYQHGLDSAIELATTQQNQVAAKRVQSQISGGRFLACFSLIKALGGGWQRSPELM